MITTAEQEQVNAAALAEWEAWKARLELERWTTSDRDPQEAIRTLVAREFVTPSEIRNRPVHAGGPS